MIPNEYKSDNDVKEANLLFTQQSKEVSVESEMDKEYFVFVYYYVYYIYKQLWLNSYKRKLNQSDFEFMKLCAMNVALIYSKSPYPMVSDFKQGARYAFFFHMDHPQKEPVALLKNKLDAKSPMPPYLQYIYDITPVLVESDPIFSEILLRDGDGNIVGMRYLANFDRNDFYIITEEKRMDAMNAIITIYQTKFATISLPQGITSIQEWASMCCEAVEHLIIVWRNSRYKKPIAVDKRKILEAKSYERGVISDAFDSRVFLSSQFMFDLLMSCMYKAYNLSYNTIDLSDLSLIEHVFRIVVKVYFMENSPMENSQGLQSQYFYLKEIVARTEVDGYEALEMTTNNLKKFLHNKVLIESDIMAYKTMLKERKNRPARLYIPIEKNLLPAINFITFILNKQVSDGHNFYVLFRDACLEIFKLILGMSETWNLQFQMKDEEDIHPISDFDIKNQKSFQDIKYYIVPPFSEFMQGNWFSAFINTPTITYVPVVFKSMSTLAKWMHDNHLLDKSGHLIENVELYNWFSEVMGVNIETISAVITSFNNVESMLFAAADYDGQALDLVAAD